MVWHISDVRRADSKRFLWESAWNWRICWESWGFGERGKSLLKIHQNTEGVRGRGRISKGTEEREVRRGTTRWGKIKNKSPAEHWLSRGTSPYVHSWIYQTVSNSPLFFSQTLTQVGEFSFSELNGVRNSSGQLCGDWRSQIELDLLHQQAVKVLAQLYTDMNSWKTNSNNKWMVKGHESKKWKLKQRPAVLHSDASTHKYTHVRLYVLCSSWHLDSSDTARHVVAPLMLAWHCR